ncbi:Vegetative incompatibility protein HET-E-1 [Ceratobasidium sp. AG-Ba]|nr:Vegetative incompatibility protein HET-E-1 [Ceratobasidium sp. AG-Ba]
MPPKKSKREEIKSAIKRHGDTLKSLLRSRPTTPSALEVRQANILATRSTTRLSASPEISLDRNIDGFSSAPELVEVSSTAPDVQSARKTLQKQEARITAPADHTLSASILPGSGPIAHELSGGRTDLASSPPTLILGDLHIPSASPINPSNNESHSTTSRFLGAQYLGYTALKSSLSTLRKSLYAIPTMQSAVDILIECVETLPADFQARDNYARLALDIKTSIDDLSEHLGDLTTSQNSDLVVKVIEQLKRQAEHIKKKQDRNIGKAYINAKQDLDDLEGCYRHIGTILRQMQNNAIMNVWKVVEENRRTGAEALQLANLNLAIGNESLAMLKTNRMDSLIRGLLNVPQARYNSSMAAKVGRTACTPDTRRTVLEGLQKWANDQHAPRIYWMNGMAGTGKTTIAYTLCTILESTHQLAASFFCSRSLADCRDVNHIIPTIARQLSSFSLPFKHKLCEALEQDQDTASLALPAQFDTLVNEPLQQVRDQLPLGLTVVVIDALDELSDRSDSWRVLDLLLRIPSDCPVKFFITCRPDSGLLDRISAAPNYGSLYHLHDIEQSLVQSDIEKYLCHSLESTQVNLEQIKRLAEQSGSLFIYASTAVQYIGPNDKSLDHQTRLNVLLGIKPSKSSRASKKLDDLYHMILSGALENDLNEQWETDSIKEVLYTVVCSREPLTLTSLACLIGLRDKNEVQRAIEPLRSVLRVDDQNGLVSTLHASFPDFMLTEIRSGAFWCDGKQQNRRLSKLCFDMMNRLLRFNICNLDSSFLLDEEVSDISTRVERSIPAHLYYACRYWADHLIVGNLDQEGTVPLDQFLRERLLFWLEVMNLRCESQVGVRMLVEVCNWLKFDRDQSTLVVCKDAVRFVSAVAANAVCRSTPHIYVSVLALWNKEAPIWTYYGSWMQGITKGAGSALEDRSPDPLVTWSTGHRIFSMSVSNDSRVIVTSSGDGSFCTWDAHSGHRLSYSCVEPRGQLYHIAFLPDGSRIVTYSSDRAVRVRDVQTGSVVAVLVEEHADPILSLCCSPDGKLVAWGLENGTIDIWGLLDEPRPLKSFECHEGPVFSVVFSPDSRRLSSGSEDKTVRIWDLQTGRMLIHPLAGHTDAVISVAYSHDGHLIVSGSSDKTIRIWDAYTGVAIGEPLEGHTGSVVSVSYSPDGRHILSGSNDQTVRVWDVHTRRTVSGPFSTGSTFASPAFILDGNQIAFPLDHRTMCIWDIHTGHTACSKQENSGPVLSVAFSPDSLLIASGSVDGTISIWDAKNGTRVAGPLTGHTDAVPSVQFSPCGSRIASGSYDETVRIWIWQAGSLLGNPYLEHDDCINAVAFSPDGNRVASTDYSLIKASIHVWDVESKQPAIAPITGHTGPILSIAFSPDGRHIAASSYNDTIRIWDMEASGAIVGLFEGGKFTVTYSPDGSRIASDYDNNTFVVRDARSGDIIGLYTGHTDKVIFVAFSSDGRFIASSSDDHSLRVWDAQTGYQVSSISNFSRCGVNSLSFSPDGQFIVSCCRDESIRVWDARTLTSTTPDPSDWKAVDKDGWVIRQDGARLFWVPKKLRNGLKWPQNISVIHPNGDWELDFSNAYIGDMWAKCYVSD